MPTGKMWTSKEVATLRRFTRDEVETLRRMVEQGHSGPTIGIALGRPAEAIRSKACALGIALRPPSLDGRRFKLNAGTWALLKAEWRRFNMRPSRLARHIVEVVMADGLLDAVIDPPRSLRRSSKLDAKWAGRLAARQFDASP